MDALEQIEQYLRHWLPGRLQPDDIALLAEVGVPVALEIADGKAARCWKLQAKQGALNVLPGDAPVTCSFALSAHTFLELASGRLSPQRAFYTFKLRPSGDLFTGLKLGGLLERLFQRYPATFPLGTAAITTASIPAARCDRPLTPHQRAMIELHLHPDDGARYWIERSQATGIRAEDLRTLDDLAVFGPMDREAEATRPFRDFLPRALRERPRGLILGESGGTTGPPVTAAWTHQDFERAFVDPLPRELERRGVHGLRQWLFAGPTGPHIIGHAADALALRTTGVEALKIDFDPRWHRRLAPGGTAALRHLEHLAEQTLLLLRRERPDALFITPALWTHLLAFAGEPWMEAIRLLHLGGQSVDPEEVARWSADAQGRLTIISGYGNSMMGCLVEEDAATPLTYAPGDGDRLVLRALVGDHLTEAAAPGEWGRVLFHRFDASRLVLNQLERDEVRVEDDGRLFAPRPWRQAGAALRAGIY